MGEHERLLLRATCILHDIGKYICMRSHSIYSYQLIMSTDIIGLSEADKEIVALASYYHANRLFVQDQYACSAGGKGAGAGCSQAGCHCASGRCLRPQLYDKKSTAAL